MAVKLFERKGSKIVHWGEREGAQVTASKTALIEDHRSINEAKRESRRLQKQGLRFERP